MLFYLLHFYFILKDKTRLLNLGKLIDWKFGLLFLVGKATQEDSEDGQWLTESLTWLWKKNLQWSAGLFHFGSNSNMKGHQNLSNHIKPQFATFLPFVVHLSKLLQNYFFSHFIFFDIWNTKWIPTVWILMLSCKMYKSKNQTLH